MGSKTVKLAAGAALAVALTTVYASPMAFAASTSTTVSDVGFNLMVPVSGLRTSWETHFTTSSDGSLAQGAGTITLEAPSGTVFPSQASDYQIQAGDHSAPMSLQSPPVVTKQGSKVTLTVPTNVGPSTSVGLLISNVVNPPASDYQGSEFSVDTSADKAFDSAISSIDISKPSANSSFLTVRSQAGSGPASNLWTWNFISSGTQELSAGTKVTLQAPTGTSLPSDAAAYLVAIGSAQPQPYMGIVHLSNQNSAVTLTIPNAVPKDSLVSIMIQNMAEPTSENYAEKYFTVQTTTDPNSIHASSVIGFPDSTGTTQVQGTSNVIAIPDFDGANQTSDWTYQFSNGSNLPSGSNITLRAPVGTKLPDNAANYKIGAGSSKAEQVSSLHVSSPNQVTISIPENISAGSQVSMDITNAVNPPAQKYTGDSFTVQTSADSKPIPAQQGHTFQTTPPDETVSNPKSTTDSFDVTTSNTAPQKSADWDFSFVTSGTHNLEAGTKITLSAPSGTALPAASGNYTIESGTGQPVVLQPSAVSVSDTSPTVTLTLPYEIPSNTFVDILVKGVKNPVAGDYSPSLFTIKTDADSRPVSAMNDINFQMPITIQSITVNGKPAPHGLTVDTSQSTLSSGDVSLQLRANGKYDLSQVGITPQDTIEVKAVVPKSYTPVTEDATGDMVSWSATEQKDGSTLLDVKATPLPSSWSDTWQGNGSIPQKADSDYKAMLLIDFTNMQEAKSVLGSQFNKVKSEMQGTFVGSNAQLLSSPYFDPTTDSFKFTVSAPHFKSDGKTVNTGWYDAFIPTATLNTAWNMQNGKVTTGSLIAHMNDSATGSSTVEPTVKQVQGGIMIDYNGFHYSGETVSINPNPMSPPSKVSHSAVLETGWTEAWSSVKNAVSYNVYVNGNKVANVKGTSYTFKQEKPATSYKVTVKAVNKSGLATAPSTADTVTTKAVPKPAAGSFKTVLQSHQFDAAGGTIQASQGNSHVELNVPSGAFSTPVQINISTQSTSEVGVTVPKGNKTVAAFGVNFPANVKPSKPVTLTITNPNIKAGGSVYKISNGKLVKIKAAKVTKGKAVITFSTDPDFVITAPIPNSGSVSSTTAKSSTSSGSTVKNATSPVTGLPFKPTAVEGGFVVLLGGALLWLSRRFGKKA